MGDRDTTEVSRLSQDGTTRLRFKRRKVAEASPVGEWPETANAAAAEESELNELGVAVYNQVELEKAVIDKVRCYSEEAREF